MVLPLSLRGEHWLCRVIRDPGSKKITGIGRQNRANISEKMPTGDLIGQLQVKRKIDEICCGRLHSDENELKIKRKANS